jgi:hypothetical protein
MLLMQQRTATFMENASLGFASDSDEGGADVAMPPAES